MKNPVGSGASSGIGRFLEQPAPVRGLRAEGHQIDVQGFELGVPQAVDALGQNRLFAGLAFAVLSCQNGEALGAEDPRVLKDDD